MPSSFMVLQYELKLRLLKRRFESYQRIFNLFSGTLTMPDSPPPIFLLTFKKIVSPIKLERAVEKSE